MKLLVFLGIFAISACTQSPDTQQLDLTGSSTVAPLIAEVARQFEKENPNFKINVQTGGSSRGIADARKGFNDIGMVSRALKPKESDLKPILLALDGVGVIVNQSVDVENITSQQLADIYTKDLSNWQTLGGKNLKISVIHKAQGRSTAEVFLKYLNKGDSDIKADIIIGDNEQGIKNVASIPGSIGYVSIGAAEIAISQGVAIKLIRLDGIAATTKNVANGTFPIRRELNLVIRNRQAPPATAAFLEYIKTPRVAKIVKDLDFVPIKI